VIEPCKVIYRGSGVTNMGELLWVWLRDGPADGGGVESSKGGGESGAGESGVRSITGAGSPRGVCCCSVDAGCRMVQNCWFESIFNTDLIAGFLLDF
jgi:hypothetical protein